MVAILQKELDASFKYAVAATPGGQHVKRCFTCGACTGGCLMSEISPEFDPRKTLRMVMLGLRREVLSSPSLWICLLCHNCSFHCPQDVRIADVMAALRFLAIKEKYLHPSFLRRLLFRRLVPSHSRLEVLTRPLTLYQALGLPSLVRKPVVQRRLAKRLGDLEYMLPPVPVRPLRRELKALIPARGKAKDRVGFFLGCADDLVFTSAGKATVALLTRNGCDVAIPAGLQCCGMPCLGYGEMEQALKLARNNLEAFEGVGVETIVTDCGTCGSCLKSYGDLLENDPRYAERAAKFSGRIKDISQFLVERMDSKVELNELDAKITYHESCHMHWVQEVSRQPRQLLGLIPGLELVEMKEAGACCGGAGSYNITHYATSMDILKRKMENVAATGAGLIATGCPGCHLQLRLGVKREGLNARVVHPAVLLEQAHLGK